MVRVLVCDTHSAIQEALNRTISGAEDLVLAGVASSLDEVNALIKEQKPDVLIVELALQGTYALDEVRRILEDHPDLRVVVYSMYDERIYAERAVRAGASGYVMKSEPTEVVVEAIHSAVNDEVYLSPQITSSLLKRLSRDERSNSRHFTAVLTDREMAVFQLLGEGYDIRAIADELHLSRKTVETYRRRAKDKLGFSSISELLQYAIRSMQV